MNDSVSDQQLPRAARNHGRIEDVYVAVMGVTGAGKSTFIQECSAMKVGIGHGLKSFTVDVEDFAFMYSPTIRVHLIDTPGFDDTETKESDILRRIAGWLGEAYENKIRLSGLVYLHRITDPRMPGSAKRNLHMFHRVCGSKCLPGVVLVTTMWNIVDVEDGARREKELIETEDFWAPMVRSGSGVLRHQGTKQSALSILGEIIRRRHPMLLKLQHQMSVEGKGLEETDAGIKLNEELYEVEKKHKEELKALEEDKKEALREKDVEAARQIAQSQKEYQSKVDAMQKQRQDLEVTMNQLKTDRANEIKAITARLKTQQKEIERRQREYDALENSRQHDKEKHEKMLQETRDEISGMKEELQEARESAERKKPGLWRRIGNFVEDVLDSL